MKKPGAPDIRIDRLLDRQMNLWEIRRRLAEEGGAPARRELAHVKQGPWITLSKSIGSGWRDVAGTIAEKLGWQIFDKEILDEIARQAPARAAIFARLDEKDVRWLEDTLAHLALPGDPGQMAYLEEMRKVILALGRKGKAILVGRGANWLLDPAFGIRLRITAPRDLRVARLVEREEWTPDQAARRVDADDQAKARFVRQVYRKEIDDPTGYDILLNSAVLPARAAAECVLAALHAKLAGVSS